MSNFTKGEWFAKREGQSTVYIECRIGGGWLQEVAACGPTANGSEEQEANAKLIAAAPDLLEALQELLASYESMMHNEFDFPNDPWSAEGRNDDEAINAQKAIAKALA